MGSEYWMPKIRINPNSGLFSLVFEWSDHPKPDKNSVFGRPFKNSIFIKLQCLPFAFKASKNWTSPLFRRCLKTEPSDDQAHLYDLITSKSGIWILAKNRLKILGCSKPLEILQIEIWKEENVENAWLGNVEEGQLLFVFPYLRYVDLHSAHAVVVAVVVEVVEFAVVLEVVVMKCSLTFWATSYHGLVAKTESIKTGQRCFTCQHANF